jgi:hypothetical protein
MIQLPAKDEHCPAKNTPSPSHFFGRYTDARDMTHDMASDPTRARSDFMTN